MQKALLDILVCPLCKGKLCYDAKHSRLICLADRLIFPIIDGIPQMLIEEAEPLSQEDYERIKASQ